MNVTAMLLPKLSSSCLDFCWIDVPVYDSVAAHSLEIVLSPLESLEVVCLRGRAV